LRLGASGEQLTTGLAVAQLAQATDPLAPGLRIAERARRLDAGLEWIAARVGACSAVAAALEPAGQAAADTEGAARSPLQADWTALEQLRRQSVGALRDSDVISDGVRLIGRLHTAVMRACPDQAPLSSTWTLIAQAHPGEA
jgi:hypothetical protein